MAHIYIKGTSWKLPQTCKNSESCLSLVLHILQEDGDYWLTGA